MQLKRIKIEIENHSVREVFWKLSESGQVTGEKYFSKVIGPEADITAESEEIQAICTAARIGYVKPEPQIEE